MEILVLNNRKEPERKIQEYGCVCPQCKSVFIFDTMDIEVPRCINAKPSMFSVKCPNPKCNTRISLVQVCVEKFKTNEDKQRFKTKYDE